MLGSLFFLYLLLWQCWILLQQRKLHDFFFLVSGFLIKSMMHPAGADLLARLVAEITLVARMGVAEHSHCRIAHHPILAALSYSQAQRPPGFTGRLI